MNIPLTKTNALTALALVVGVGALAVWPDAAQAVYLVPDCARTQGGEAPSLACALLTFTNIANIILGLTGSMALLMFIWGGFKYLTGGSKGADEGKTIIRNAIVGIVIIMTSGLLLQYGMKQLGVKDGFVIGQSCKNGAGQYVQMPTGKLECVESCNAKLLGGTYACVKDADTGSYGNCIAGLCKGGPNEMCCTK